MKNTGIVRQVDELGRIVLPIELRRMMGLEEKDPVEVFIDDEAQQIILRKYRTQECLFCNSTEGLVYFRERFICASCLGELIPDRQIGCWESAAAYEDGGNGEIEAAPSKQNRKHGESLKRLAKVMQAHPEASQKEWARMLGLTQGRVSQLLKEISSSVNQLPC